MLSYYLSVGSLFHLLLLFFFLFLYKVFMTALGAIVYLQLFLKWNFFFFSVSTTLLSFFFFLFSFKNSNIKLGGNIVNTMFKCINIIFYLVSFVLLLTSFYFFFRLVEAYRIDVSMPSDLAYVKQYNLEIISYKFEIDLFGFILLLLAYIVGFLALLTLDTRLSQVNFNYFIYFNYFILIVFFFVITNDIILLFFFYEMLLLPSFFFVYSVSYSKKAIQASLYFVIWTQLGSLIVLLAVLYLVNKVGSTAFFVIKHCPLLLDEATLVFSLLFVGFGFKIPIWPFHYWLTKVHVEAPSGFSIYLSGFLVKTALFGLFKLSNLLFHELNTEPFIFIAFLGAIDASLKMWGQSDLKKLVAYCTIQEMNLILLTYLWGDSFIAVCGFFFSAVHAFLSSLMFYLVDCIYRRYHTRSTFSVTGIFTPFPNLGLVIFFMLIFFAGLPGTVKFACEFYVFSTVLSSSFLSCFFLMFVLNFFGLVGFSRGWFNALFGLPSTGVPVLTLDLSKKELLISSFLFFFLFFSTFFFFFII